MIAGTYAIDYGWVSGMDIPLNANARIGYATIGVSEPGYAYGLMVGMSMILARARRRPNNAVTTPH